MKIAANGGVRRRARAADVPLWGIADHLGISEATLTRWLRFPLSVEREAHILEAISILEQGAER